MQAREELTRLRQGVLAVEVLDDVDLDLDDLGVRLPTGGVGRPGPVLPWADLASVCGPHDALSPAGRTRLRSVLRIASRLAEQGPEAAARTLRHQVVALALPAGHTDHLGHGWVVQALRGGVLDLGLGIVDSTQEPSRTNLPIPLPRFLTSLVAPEVSAELLWTLARERVLRLSRQAAGSDVGPRQHQSVLHPRGGCDVLTLLAAAPLRHALASGDGTGMRAVAVPTRERGWCDLRDIDPAFVATVWSAVSPEQRGVDRPLLVTRDEVCLPRPASAVRY